MCVCFICITILHIQAVNWNYNVLPTLSHSANVVVMQPYGFDVGASDYGIVLKGLDYGVAGMRVGGQVSSSL